ncbi:relaxase domain-containing protein [Nocardioides sp. NBC_00368]|uniref:MobF family relaxase n=1 Tax=Nocardioides sp. NBC_00368 TaxID=2976000 RepID=UPI002E1F3126
MGLHKLTAGDGYTYLTRSVAVHDATDRGHTGLGEYYSEKGESPGRWWGSGLPSVDLAPGDEVNEQQMKNLFGQGRHPDAERLERDALDQGASPVEAAKAANLGNAFAVCTGNAPDFVQETARKFIAYNRAHGLHWRTPVPTGARAQIRTQIANEMFAEEHRREPLDDRERAGFLAQATRQRTKAVAGFDLTFTPVKSVSTLWALANRDVARQIEAAHHAAVKTTLTWLENNVLFTRRGRGGVQQVKTRGMIAALFTHRDSRSSDPHLHTHVALSNKVQDPTGRWLAVDGRVLHKANVTLSETYNTLLEGELIARLGVRFEPREGPTANKEKGVVREIVGVDPRLAVAWSSRNRHIEARRRELTAEFQDTHGRPPTAGEAVGLTRQAWADTRRAKHAPRSEAEQRETWRSEAARILGSDAAVIQVVTAALGRGDGFQRVSSKWIRETAAAVVAKVQDKRATWQVWHLRAEAQRQVRTAGVRLVDVATAVDRVVERAIEEHSIAFVEPDPLIDPERAKRLGVDVPVALTRSDGESVYSVHGAQRFTSKAVLEAEQRILVAAEQTGGRRISDVRVGIAIAETAANGVTLNSAQAAMVRELATSGQRVQLALAPAGTGKTTAMEVLARAWRDAGGNVIGLAPQAVAAQELDTAINPPDHDRVGHSDTLAKLVWHLEHGDEPPWMQATNHRTLVLIDEAGAASTPDLATAIDHLVARGACVRLVGDDKQLASVAAGGVLRDLAHETGAVTLTEVRRFLNPDGSLNTAEAAATLAIRDGDPSAIAFYADRGRIHVGDLGTAADQAYVAWHEDRAAGRDSLLIAPTNELVADLNTRARRDRISALSPTQIGRTVTLTDGTRASAGDAIITRSNNRMLAISATDWVKNRDRWTVTQVHDDGSMTVRHDKLRKQVRLPAAYVSTSVQLGYATTVHGAQGATVDTCHLVLTGEEDRNLLYVGLSRGRFANHLYLASGHNGDPHELVRPEALIPPTALDELIAMLERDGSPVSATSEMRAIEDPRQVLCDAVARYQDAVSVAAESTLGSRRLDDLDHVAEALVDGLTNAPAWPTLRSHLALIALDGHEPIDLLTEALGNGALDDARDAAAVLNARLDRITPSRTDLSEPNRSRHLGQLPWLPSIPAQLAGDVDWGPYLTARRSQVNTAISAVSDLARSWTGGSAPAWAKPFLDNTDAGLRTKLAIWRAAMDVDDVDRRPTGPSRIGAPGDHQADLNQAVRAARPSYPHSQRAWYQALPKSVRHDPWITPLCERLAKLERAGLPVTDYLTKALTDDPTGQCGRRPLPDEHQAAALWWRLVPHLGPAALEASAHTYDLLTPTWNDTVNDLVGQDRANYLRHAPVWPALVAAVDEACAHHNWTPREILRDAISGLPDDGSLTGHEVADAIVLRIATLTDPPTNADDAPDDLDRPDDLDNFMTEVHRDLDDTAAGRTIERIDPAQAAYAALVKDPYAPPLPASGPADVEHAFPEPGEIPAERILDLNQQALAYFRSCYPRSWAPAYMTDRLATDLSNHTEFSVGYAPQGPRSLLTHLTATGATLDELEQAGLIRARNHRDGTSEWVDVFRDRVILPIHDPSGAGVIGFIGRRNPSKTDDDYAGPKYLNTRTTSVFTKGEALFGYAENRDSLAAGALPVIVEGPMDAVAITLATGGTAVGLAPMGTALTTEQIKLLLRHINLETGRDRIAVAYDNDTAGWKAARTAFWHLTSADLDPTFAALPNGLDPAELARTRGPDALTAALAARRPLGEAIIDQHLAQTAGAWTEPAVRQELITRAADVLAARGPDSWPDELGRINKCLCLSDGVLAHAAIEASTERDSDRASYARARVDRINAHPGPMFTPPSLSMGITSADSRTTGITAGGRQPAFHPTARPSAAPRP